MSSAVFPPKRFTDPPVILLHFLKFSSFCQLCWVLYPLHMLNSLIHFIDSREKPHIHCHLYRYILIKSNGIWIMCNAMSMYPCSLNLNANIITSDLCCCNHCNVAHSLAIVSRNSSITSISFIKNWSANHINEFQPAICDFCFQRIDESHEDSESFSHMCEYEINTSLCFLHFDEMC